jgi:predicted site-specific integrase-resolvase
MRLSDWAKTNGISYRSAWRMWKAGTLPVPAEQFPTGAVIVHVESFSSALRMALSLPKDDRQRLIQELQGSL